ncbi:MAG: hypothetical protein ABJP76_12990, partial [Flavobacteriaceae bacterium]
MKLLYSFTFLISLVMAVPQAKNVSEEAKVPSQEQYDDLTLKEWKKFKRFEKQLQKSPVSQATKLNELKGYTRDSLHILTIKLAAIKILDEKQLLERDIAEHTRYYQELLVQLKESSIERSTYLFLEDRINTIVTENFQRKIQYSSWLVYGLVFLV